MSSEITPQYSHSLKIEETAKEIRLSVHVWANDEETAMTQAVKLYEESRQKLIDDGFIVASLKQEEVN